MTVTFTQDSNSQTMSTDCSYLANMSDDLAGNMAFIISNWNSSDQTWLWKDRCSGTCNMPDETISNIKIIQGDGKPVPPKPYDPADYEF